MLIQIDLFFRLLCDTPPVLTANLDNWRVNLPTISAEESETGPRAVTTSCFIVGSRVTLILAQFFQLLEAPTRNDETLFDEALALCDEIEKVFDEWQFVSVQPRFPSPTVSDET